MMNRTISLFLVSLMSSVAFGASNLNYIKSKSELEVRNLLTKVIDKYCADECKILSVDVQVDVAIPEELAPGFDDVATRSSGIDLAPAAATVKMLIDEKVGPVSRGKLMDFIDQYVHTLKYPVQIDTKITRFPLPVETARKIGRLRNRVKKDFQSKLDNITNQFCPSKCIVANVNLSADAVNSEEAQYGDSGEFAQDGEATIKVKDISATILMDETLSPQERNAVLEMARLKTTVFKNVTLSQKAIRFPTPEEIQRGTYASGGYGYGKGKPGEQNTKENNRKISSTTQRDSNTSTKTFDQRNNTTNNSQNQTSSTNESNTRKERFERIERIERVEDGGKVQKLIKQFQIYALIFGAIVLSLLVFIAIAGFRKGMIQSPAPFRGLIQSIGADSVESKGKGLDLSGMSKEDRATLIAKRYEIERIHEELSGIFAQHPNVAKTVFSKILTEDGVEETAAYVQMFGDGVVMDMLHDPSLQSDMAELMDFYAKNPMELNDDEKLELLQALHNKTVAAKLVVMGNRSSSMFDYLSDMDGLQIMELVRNESVTVKAIALTQASQQKRAQIFSHLTDKDRMALLNELSRIDYLPRDYVYNVANALKRKKHENPKLNTESLPGSEVLLGLLERTGIDTQQAVVRNLEVSNPDSARTVKGKLVSIDTLRYLRDSQLLEVVLSLKHEELLQFLAGAPEEIRNEVFAKSPNELVEELEEELGNVKAMSREAYQSIERKVLNRMKIMAQDGLINLVETNERMFAGGKGSAGFIEAGPGDSTQAQLAV